MSSIKSKLVDHLETITEYCNDSIKGYESAAESVKDSNPFLSTQWASHAILRRRLSDALSERLRDIGESGDQGGSIKGAIHRGILKLRETVSGDDVNAAVKECLRGETELQDAIVETLEESKTDGATSKLLRELKFHVDECIRNLEAIRV